MPPWNPGPADTICSGCPPSTTVVMTTSSTLQTVQSIPTSPPTTTDAGKLNMTISAAGLGRSTTASDLEIGMNNQRYTWADIMLPWVHTVLTVGETLSY